MPARRQRTDRAGQPSGPVHGEKVLLEAVRHVGNAPPHLTGQTLSPRNADGEEPDAAEAFAAPGDEIRARSRRRTAGPRLHRGSEDPRTLSGAVVEDPQGFPGFGVNRSWTVLVGHSSPDSTSCPAQDNSVVNIQETTPGFTHDLGETKRHRIRPAHRMQRDSIM